MNRFFKVDGQKNCDNNWYELNKFWKLKPSEFIAGFVFSLDFIAAFVQKELVIINF